MLQADLVHACDVQGEAAKLATYLGQPQGSDPAWVLETLAGFVMSYDQALQVLMSKVSLFPPFGPAPQPDSINEARQQRALCQQAQAPTDNDLLALLGLAAQHCTVQHPAAVMGS